MTIGFPVTFTFQGSNVKDPIPTLEELLLNCQAPVISKGLEVKDGDFIWVYNNKISYTPRTWDAEAEGKGVYLEDEVLYVPCNGKDASGHLLPADLFKYKGKLIKVTGKAGQAFVHHQRPLEPEEYGVWDTSFDPSHWKQRWVRIPAFTTANYYGNQFFNSGKTRNYLFAWDCRGVVPTIGSGGWICTALEYANVCDKLNVPNVKRVIKHVTGKFDAAGDIKASVFKWGVRRGPEDTILFNSMIERGGYVYLRTNVNKPVKYAKWRTGKGYSYSYSAANSPADIDGFFKARHNMGMAPFDGKNHTTCFIDTKSMGGYASWDLMNNEPFDTIALGNIRCDKIDITITDVEDAIWSEIIGYPIDNSIGYTIPLPKADEDIEVPDDGNDFDSAEDDHLPNNIKFKTNQQDTVFEHGITRVIYTDRYIPEQCKINIKLYGDVIEIGELLGADSIDGGFTNVNFKNTFKDFSPKEQDQWGNWEYIDGVRVQVHAGTVDFPIMRYDQMAKMMMKIGGNKVVINSSDSYKNEYPDSKNVFGATMMIARFTKFELTTKSINKRIGDKGSYTFAIEELV